MPGKALRSAFGFPGRFALGFGLTDQDNRYRLAVRVYDAETKEWFEKKYADLFNKHGDDIDIREIGVSPPALELPPAPLAAALNIGMGIRHERGNIGSLGFFARRNGTRGFVSCNHVIAIKDRGRNRDKILNDQGSHIGTLARFHKLQFSVGGIFQPRADCAYASVSDDLFPEQPGEIAGVGKLLPQRPRLTKAMTVHKIGRASSQTRGKIVSADYDEFEAFFGNEFQAILDNVIEIESDQPAGAEFPSFAMDGDSGALVFSDDLMPVGMVFYVRGAHTFANRIDLVERALRVKMIV
ncbi:MAG TPA: hypothetical protein VFV49_11290 [Thermoanaerobaculia bacterium]|nr:hypothetical protein [Thermoanaerobaculia bacterium]